MALWFGKSPYSRNPSQRSGLNKQPRFIQACKNSWTNGLDSFKERLFLEQMDSVLSKNNCSLNKWPQFFQGRIRSWTNDLRSFKDRLVIEQNASILSRNSGGLNKQPLFFQANALARLRRIEGRKKIYHRPSTSIRRMRVSADTRQKSVFWGEYPWTLGGAISEKASLLKVSDCPKLTFSFLNIIKKPFNNYLMPIKW